MQHDNSLNKANLQTSIIKAEQGINKCIKISLFVTVINILLLAMSFGPIFDNNFYLVYFARVIVCGIFFFILFLQAIAYRILKISITFSEASLIFTDSMDKFFKETKKDNQ